MIVVLQILDRHDGQVDDFINYIVGDGDCGDKAPDIGQLQHYTYIQNSLSKSLTQKPLF